MNQNRSLEENKNDLIVFIIVSDTLTSWFKEGNNSLFSLTVAKNNLSYSLEGIMEKSQNLEQIVVLIEFRNISHLENEMQVLCSFYWTICK